MSSRESQTDLLKRYERKIAEDYAWADDKEIYEWLKANISATALFNKLLNEYYDTDRT